jgi:hypothetical protein
MAGRGSDQTGEAIAWRAIPYGTPVSAPDGTRIGTVREVLGSDGEDIFHGLRVRLEGAGRDVMVGADDVTAITSDRVAIDLDRPTANGLPDFDVPATYHLASVGWLRHHLGWKDDAKSDEEPG